MIASLMEYTNYLIRVKETGTITLADWKEAVDVLLNLLAPTAPHTTEEIWHLTGHNGSIHNETWPKWDEALTKEDEITLVIQVNGKLRDRITVSASVSEAEAKRVASESSKVKPFTEGKEVVNIIYVPGRLVNIVVK
jgi:leucyl-tRNA synthetase